jgi:TRAP-type C4-dicarboxylate transport system substrate-binding protein
MSGFDPHCRHAPRPCLAWVVALGLVLAPGWAGAAVADAAPVGTDARRVLKIATLAPEGSSWAGAMRAIDTALAAQTGGTLRLRLYPGGVLGDEPVALRKLRIGQVQGLGLTGLGLAELCPDIRALEMPFLFADYGEVDHVLTGMTAYYQAQLAASGVVLLGWTDVGYVHILSRDPVRTAADLQSRRVWQLDNEPITAALFNHAGVAAVRLCIPDVLLGLQTGLVDVVYAPPAAAVALQWFTRVGWITVMPVNYTLGALVVEQRALTALTAAEQEVVRQVAAAQMERLTQATRRQNQEAMAAMLTQGLRPVQPDQTQVQAFRDLVEQVRPELVGTAFAATAATRIDSLLAAFRARPR